MTYKFFRPFLLLCCLGITFNLSAQSTTDPTIGCFPLSIKFQAPAGATSSFWDFGDGDVSTEANPDKTFLRPGDFQVSYSAASGGTVTGTISVTVFDPPNLAIAQDPEVGCAPGNIALTNTTQLPDGISITGTQWTFQDGTGATTPNTDKEFFIPGDYSVTLAIKTNSTTCDVTRDFADFIKVVAAPDPTFTINPGATACVGPLDVTFTNTTGGDDLIYTWDLGNGTMFSGANPPNQTYPEGDYDVSLTAVNEEGCSKTTIQKISVGLPIADFTIPDTICIGVEEMIENSSSAGAYTWTINGPENMTSNEVNPILTFNRSGDYTIRLFVDAGECNNEITIPVYVQEVDATFAADPIYSCFDPTDVSFTPNSPLAGATYNWTFEEDRTSTEMMPTYTYDAPNDSPYHPNGEFPYAPTLIMTSNSGCADTVTSEVILDIPLSRFMPDTVSGCAPLTVELRDLSESTQTITNWEWIYGDGNTDNRNNNDPHDYIFSDTGSYEVQLVITNDLNCVDTSFVILVEVGAPTNPSIAVDKESACIGDMIQFSEGTNNPTIDEWHFYTDDDRSSHCFDEANPMIPFETATGQFDVTLVTGFHGCLDSVSSANLIAIAGPVAHIDYMLDCTTPNTVMFTSSSQEATTLSWDFGDGETGTNETESHDYVATGDYTVMLTAENPSTGCAASTDTALIHIRNIKADGPVELLQCKSQPVMLNSGSSTDVDTSCARGYTWFFNHDGLRPVTTSLPTVDDISYPDTGMYVIDLVVEDINGCTDTASYPIIVHEAMISFEVDKTEICTPQSITISNIVTSTTSESIESYMWMFGDSLGMSDSANPGSYTYTTDLGADVMEVVVSVAIEDDAGCPGNFDIQLPYYRVNTTITAGDLTICADESIEFTGGTFTRNGELRPLDYEWSFGANTQTASNTFDEGGMYDIGLTVTETSTGCQGSTNVTARVQDYPVAAFTTSVDDQDRLCAPTNVNFTNTSESMVPLTQSWDFGNGSFGSGTTSTTSYNPGTYTVTLNTQTSFGCSDTISRNFLFEEGPTADIQLSKTTACIGDEVIATITNDNNVVDFYWEYQGTRSENGVTSFPFIVTETSSSGQVIVSLTLTGIGDCIVANDAVVQVNDVNADFVRATGGEACSTIVGFTNTSSGNNLMYSWDFGDGNTSIDPNPSHDYGSSGTYTVTLKAEDPSAGCSSETSQIITVGAIEFNGTFEAEVNCYTVTVTPDASFFDDFVSIEYDFGEENSEPTLSSTHTYQSVTASYTITVTGFTADGCTSSVSKVVMVPFIEGEAPEYVPNTFTPKSAQSGTGVGVNDFFQVYPTPTNGVTSCDRIHSVYAYRIFNRFGKEVFAYTIPGGYDLPKAGDIVDPTMPDESHGWNGKGGTSFPGDGDDFPIGVYLYIIDVAFAKEDPNNPRGPAIAGDRKELRGNVTLAK